ncbi:helix-turn-helix domain-containing protein [Lutibacter sp.]|uniref:helix-turn-helix domain-containing protein n=1 Tax=Lutibacter sp. TaxID=1925666 RepID=UPI003569DFB7
MKFPENNIIDSWLDQNGDAEIARLVEKNLAITEKIIAVLKEKNIKKLDFAKMLGKKPSEVTKWLSGTHNLTMKSINKIEMVLNINLINIDPITEYKYVYLGSIKGENMSTAINNYENSNYDVAL